MKENQSSIKNMSEEFAIEAEMAEKRGDLKTARLFYQKAFFIEKENLNETPKGERYQLTRSIYANNTVHYAYFAGLYAEAIQIAENFLSNASHEAVAPDLKSILKKAKTALENKSTSSETKITGTLIGADLPSGTFKLLGKKDNQYYGIQTSKEEIVEIVKNFWAKQVEVIGKKIQDGTINLEKIELVA